MNKILFNYRHSIVKVTAITAFASLFAIVGCNKSEIQGDNNLSPSVSKSPKSFKDFEQVNLIANNDEYNAPRVDEDFINAWGIAFAPSGVSWVNTEGTGFSYVLNPSGADLRPEVAIPSPTMPTGGAPSGIVFNGTTDFKLMNGMPARFIFVGTDGVLSGWNGGNVAERILNNSSSAAYTGLALGNDGGANFLYAANFLKARIDVFNNTFNMVSKPFVDPDLPAGYAPFNIQNIGGKLYVLYAKQDPASPADELHGNGLGYVSIFNTDGSFVKRFVSNGQLNAPWGIAWAPTGFFGDEFPSDMQVILIGNFGDGHINAYDADGRFLKELRAHGNPIVIKGLWSITFPPATSTNGIDVNALYFSAGPDDEADGLYGYIKKQSN